MAWLLKINNPKKTEDFFDQVQRGKIDKDYLYIKEI